MQKNIWKTRRDEGAIIQTQLVHHGISQPVPPERGHELTGGG